MFSSRNYRVQVGRAIRRTDGTFHHDVIRHRGTCQHFFWAGPMLLIWRNRSSVNAITPRQEA